MTFEHDGRTIRVIFENRDMVFGYPDGDPLKKQFFRKEIIAGTGRQGESEHADSN